MPNSFIELKKRFQLISFTRDGTKCDNSDGYIKINHAAILSMQKGFKRLSRRVQECLLYNGTVKSIAFE